MTHTRTTSGAKGGNIEFTVDSALRTILDSLPDYVMLIDEAHRILFANSAVVDAFNVTPEQIVGGFCPEVVHGLDEPFPGCPLEEASREGCLVERELFDPNTESWTLAAAYPTGLHTEDGRRVFLHFARDTTDRRRAEQGLQRHADTQAIIGTLLRLSLDRASLDDILRKALELVLSIPWLSAQGQGCVFLVGDTPDVLVMRASQGLSPAILESCGHVPFGRCMCGRAALTGEIQFADHVDDRHDVHYDGMSGHGHYCVPITYGDRSLGAINIYVREDHKRETSEEEFLDAVANTLAGIIVRSQAEAENERVNRQLIEAQKMEAIGALAAGVAHDFNNLLTVILGNADLALMNMDQADPLHEKMNMVVHAANRATDLTRQLLLFSHKSPMERVPLNINSTVENLHKMLGRLIGENISIVRQLDPEPRKILADAGNLEQVVMNLAVNARDAMPDGGRLTFETRNVTLSQEDCRSMPGSRPGTFVRLSVSDTGTGIDAESIRRIFDPFYTTKEAGRGTGLGLSVVLAIVQQHDGWITVDSRPGTGTVFRMYFPALSSDAPDEKEQVASGRLLRGNGEKVLLVEDDIGIREFAAQGLRENGYEVFQAKNSKEARSLSRTIDFDVVFSDVVLPDATGLGLAEQLVADKPALRVLLTSGYTDTQSLWPAMRSRGFRFLSKPYTLMGVLQAFRAVLQDE